MDGNDPDVSMRQPRGGTRFAVRTHDDGEVHTVWLDGELDLASAEGCVEAVQPLLDGSREVLLDISGLTFIDSTGLRQLLSIGEWCRQAGIAIELRGAQPQVMSALRMTGALDLLPAADE